MSYQGWTNYPTWCIHLWITNEEGLYRAWRDEAQTSWEGSKDCKLSGLKGTDPVKERKWSARCDLADKLKDSWEYQASEPENRQEGFWADLQSWALAQVDWHEVAEALLEDIDG